jgi:hypothetical protein
MEPDGTPAPPMPATPQASPLESGSTTSSDASAVAASSQDSWYQKKKLAAFLDVLKTLLVICGVPIGIYTYATNKIKERHEAEWQAYEKMDDGYWTYERLAMDYPRLNVSDVHASDPELSRLTKPRNQLTPEERIHERQLMYMLIAMYERAFILYSSQSTALKEAQWEGWENGLQRWCGTPAFREAWQHIGEDFDKHYQEHVNAVIKASKP